MSGTSAVEATEFRVSTEREYGCASVAVKAEKRATKSYKIIVLFLETETAKQNQKFSFLNFRFSAGGVGGADKKWKGNFWFCFAVSVSEKSTIIL